MIFLRSFFISSMLFVLMLADIAHAVESVEVAPQVYVNKVTFSVPINEQPFFGFAKKSPEQITADNSLLAYIDEQGIPKEKAFARAIRIGWQALGQKDFAQAGRRFNQAHLIIPGHPAVFHGFAVLVNLRFSNLEFAEHLFHVGSGLKNRNPGYMADYGRFLLVNGQAGKAVIILEEAVQSQPRNPTAWSNLAWARLQNGMVKKACDAAVQGTRLRAPLSIKNDLRLLQKRANCNG